MENKNLQRNSSIELLRIIAMIGVLILHYNLLGKAFNYVISGSYQEKYIFLSETVFVCAVNLFVMISAYFLATTEKRKFVKVVELLGQVIVFKAAFYIANILQGHSTLSFSGIFKSVLPDNYFVIFYCIVYIVSPYINIMIKDISKKDFKKLVIILFFLFSVWNMVVGILENMFGRLNGLNTVGLWGDQGGYTIVNFILVYFIGAYIRLNNISVSKTKSIACILVGIALIYFEKIIGNAVYSSSKAWDYNNPIVILLPVFIILFFNKLNFSSKIINELAKAAFTCYLFHGYFMSKLGVEKFVNGNIFMLILHQFGCAIAIYLASYIVYKIYNTLTRPIIKRITPICNRVDISIKP